MKAITIFLAGLAMGFQHLNSADIKVYGQCEVCKHRIETTLKQKGIYSASWNVETKMLTVQYDDQLISADKIQQILAMAGHDTDKFHASDKAYNALPVCCHYPRAKS